MPRQCMGKWTLGGRLRMVTSDTNQRLHPQTFIRQRTRFDFFTLPSGTAKT